MSQQASAKNKKAILTASALLSFLAFAMTFATNSRPAYALIVCALSPAGFGVLALMRSEHASAALRDSYSQIKPPVTQSVARSFSLATQPFIP